MNEFLKNTIQEKIFDIITGDETQSAKIDLVYDVVMYAIKESNNVREMRLESVKLAKIFLPEGSEAKSMLNYADKIADFVTYGTVPK